MKRGRKKPKEREFIFGVNPITEAIRAGRRKIYGVYVKSGAIASKQTKALLDLAGRKRIHVERMDMEKIAKLAGAEGHQGILAEVSLPAYSNLEKLIERSLKNPRESRPAIAALDGVQDPRNLGAIIRSAEAFGFDGVIIPRDRAASYSPVAAKASAGAGEHMSLCQVTNMAEAVRLLKEAGFSCVALEGEAGEDFTGGPEGPIVIALGSEGVGVRPLVIKRCGITARIPMSGRINSLNVSTAAAVAFYITRHGAAKG